MSQCAGYYSVEMGNNNDIVSEFEEKARRGLTEFLVKKGALDEIVPECADLEEKWPVIVRSYLPDGAREFQNYPVVSLGWMMFVGMAMAHYWDEDWESNAARTDFYTALRDRRGYDEMDEAVLEEVIKCEGDELERVSDLVADCASRMYSLIMHAKVEPGTQEAFGIYVATLHQLYLAGVAVELNALGYHMTKI